MSEFTLILVRHGHVEGIEPARFRGRLDLPLTERGWSQARATAVYIGSKWPIAAVYASPLSRCMDTGQIIAAEQGLQVQACDHLLDLDYGPWQGRIRAEIRKEEPALYDAWMERPDLTVIEGAETLQEAQARVVRGLAEIRRDHPRQTIVAVGHDSTNRVLLTLLLGLPLSHYWHLQQDPCAISLIKFERSGPRVVEMNSTAHLDGLRQNDAKGR
jgi:broad specificity phosphatase PhoE